MNTFHLFMRQIIHKNDGKYRFLLNSTTHHNPQKDKFGVYSSIGVYGRRPKYSRVNSQGAEEYAFHLEKQGRGLWIVAPSLGQQNGWLTVRYLSYIEYQNKYYSLTYT